MIINTLILSILESLLIKPDVESTNYSQAVHSCTKASVMLFWRILDGFTGWALPTAKVLPCFTVKTQIHLVHGIVDTHAVLIYTFALK